jgi:maleate isomerase
VISLGVLTPHATPGADVEFAAMAPGRVITRVARVGSADPTDTAALRVLATRAHLNQAAEELRTDPIQAIGYASTTSAYVIGCNAETVLMAQLAEQTGLPVASTGASALHALRVLDVERIALIGAPWFDPEYNRLAAAYFTSRGLEVVFVASADLPKDPDAIEPAAVYDWAVRRVADDAQALFIGGNGFRAADAVEAIEAAIDRPVLTANQVLLWRLLAHVGATFPVTGYGQLFTHRA